MAITLVSTIMPRSMPKQNVAADVVTGRVLVLNAELFRKFDASAFHRAVRSRTKTSHY